MDVKRGRMVFLGYGKYWRPDRILGLMPIEQGRGPGQRTNVFIEGRAEPIIASRTEESILEDMGASDVSFQLEALRDATRELLEAFHEFSPVLRRALHNEHHFDLEKWEQRMATLLRPIEHPDSAQQDDSSIDERRQSVLRPPARSFDALLHRDVGALQLLRDAGISHPVHDEGAGIHGQPCQ